MQAIVAGVVVTKSQVSTLESEGITSTKVIKALGRRVREKSKYTEALRKEQCTLIQGPVPIASVD